MAIEQLSPEIKQILTGIAGVLPTAALGRALAHHQLVRLGHRKFFSRDLLWELPTVAFCGIVGGGLAAYLELPPMAVHAVVAVTAYMGPRGIEVLLTRWVEKGVKKGAV